MDSLARVATAYADQTPLFNAKTEEFSDALDSYYSQAKIGGLILLIQTMRSKRTIFPGKLTVAEIDRRF
jgi:hypothetical protein